MWVFLPMRNEGKVCKLTIEDNKEHVHAIFRNKSKCVYSFGEGKKERKNKEKDLEQKRVGEMG